MIVSMAKQCGSHGGAASSISTQLISAVCPLTIIPSPSFDSTPPKQHNGVWSLWRFGEAGPSEAAKRLLIACAHTTTRAT
jgi:hypothetical protein